MPPAQGQQQRQQQQQQAVTAPEESTQPDLQQQPSAEQQAHPAVEADPHSWQPEELDELVRLAEDGGYRQAVLGSSKISWAAIGQHLGVRAKAAKSRFFSERYSREGGMNSLRVWEQRAAKNQGQSSSFHVHYQVI